LLFASKPPRFEAAPAALKISFHLSKMRFFVKSKKGERSLFPVQYRRPPRRFSGDAFGLIFFEAQYTPFREECKGKLFALEKNLYFHPRLIYYCSPRSFRGRPERRTRAFAPPWRARFPASECGHLEVSHVCRPKGLRRDRFGARESRDFHPSLHL
jgi:hypothetical protein